MSNTAHLYAVTATTWQEQVIWQVNGSPIDNTGYSASMDVRDWQGNLVINLATTNSRISLGGSNGTFYLTIAEADNNLVVGDYWFDLVVTDGSGVVTQIVYGLFTVQRRVTQ